jgi:mannosyltransferase
VIWPLYVLVLGLGMVHFRKKFSHFLFLATLIAVPFLGELIVSIRRPIFFDRTLIWTTIPLYLILAAGITQLKFRPLIVLALGVFGTLNMFSVGDYYRFFQKEDWDAPAGYVGYYAEKDDLILFNSNFVEIPFNYYFRVYEDKWRLQVDKQGFPLDLLDSGMLEPAMTANDVPRLISLIREYNRVWLVYSHESYTDPNGLIPETLASQKKLTRKLDFYGGQVQLYETP